MEAQERPAKSPPFRRLEKELGLSTGRWQQGTLWSNVVSAELFEQAHLSHPTLDAIGTED